MCARYMASCRRRANKERGMEFVVGTTSTQKETEHKNLNLNLNPYFTNPNPYVATSGKEVTHKGLF